jgi:Zn-dependent M28 family amino/carboxypeptidase
MEKIMYKNIIVAILLLLLVFHTNKILERTKVEETPKPPTPVKKDELTYDKILNLIQKEDIKKHIIDLSSKEFCGRATGSEGNIRAADYIKNYLESLNIKYKEQKFLVKGKLTTNIIAYIVPENDANNQVIVIGAHYDHLGMINNQAYYPGADDNASGVSALMSICKALNAYKNKLKNTISIQFYSAEELGLLGSKFYVNNPVLPLSSPSIDKHIAMINLDMIGYLKNNYQINENVAKYREDKSSIVFNYQTNISPKNIVAKLYDTYPFSKHICSYRPGGSDHAPFYNKGIPIVFLHTGLHSNYHKISDTPDKLNYLGIVEISKFAFEILVAIDKY